MVYAIIRFICNYERVASLVVLVATTYTRVTTSSCVNIYYKLWFVDLAASCSFQLCRMPECSATAMQTSAAARIPSCRSSRCRLLAGWGVLLLLLASQVNILLTALLVYTTVLARGIELEG